MVAAVGAEAIIFSLLYDQWWPPVTMLWRLVTSEEWQQSCSPLISRALDTGVIGCDQVCSTDQSSWQPSPRSQWRCWGSTGAWGWCGPSSRSATTSLSGWWSSRWALVIIEPQPFLSNCEAETNTKYCSGWVDWWWRQWQLGTCLGKLWSLLLVHWKVREWSSSQNIFVETYKILFAVSVEEVWQRCLIYPWRPPSQQCLQDCHCWLPVCLSSPRSSFVNTGRLNLSMVTIHR